MLILTREEVVEMRQLLTAMYGDLLLSIAYRSRIARCLVILSKHPV